MKSNPQDPSLATQAQWQRFGALVRDRRNAARLSRLDVAHLAKLSDATIKFVETARHQPTRATLIRLVAVAELHLTWAEVPGQHAPPEGTQDIPAPPQLPPPLPPLPPLPPPPPLAPVEPSPDPAQFLMDLIGFDEIRLPPGAPKTLRIFQQRHRDGERAVSHNRTDGRDRE